MAKKVKFGKAERLDFSKIPAVMELPNLISIQKDAYDQFLQMDVDPAKRIKTGLQKSFTEVFPLCDFHGNPILEFLGYTIGEPKYDVLECYERDMTYSAPLRIKVRLIVRDEGKNGALGQIRNVKEQEVYMGEIPLMTEQGAFIINGAARVIVSQLHRSPGVAFSVEKESAPGKKLYTARIIPYRGTWLSFEIDAKDILFARINRKRKFHGTLLLRALGFSSDEEILNLFLNYQEVSLGKRKKDLLDQVVYEDVVAAETGEIIIEKGEKITEEILHSLKEANIERIKLIVSASSEGIITIKNTLEKDKYHSTEEALIEIYKKIRPGEPPTLESARSLLERMFFDPKRYDLSKVGRYKINKKIGMDVPLEHTALRREDLVEIVKYLINLQQGVGTVGDIDHLGNRRVRTVGELLEIQIQVGLSRMERTIKERINTQDIDKLMPSNLINAKPMMAAIKDFFSSSQLSQFMDQTNPLSELTHKRRLSALGPDGLSRERAGFEVRDVHHTHYGRICPIETPEGPNIGLIVSLSNFARINSFGFLETPYRRVKNGKVTEQIEFLTADVEDQHIIAQANAELDKKGSFVASNIIARHKGDFPQVTPDEVDYMDVSPMQLVSVATALIPFLEHDDANRALMGSNMQRQAVPLLTSEAPYVGTGMEYRAAKDSGVVVVAKRSGMVDYVSADKIIVKVDDEDEDFGYDNTDVYLLQKYRRSNQDTWINQIPIITKGEHVNKGEILADGPSTSNGEMALGKNLMVAFMPWGGYNFEDAILISEKVVRENRFTSVHVEEFEVEARDIKLGREEITRDIPNVGEDALRNLDENGIIRVGAEITPGDILVGKVTPKGETELSPEERLLKAIFGEKAESVRDTSLRAGPSDRGIVVDVKTFSRTEKDKDEATKKREQQEKKKIENEYNVHLKILNTKRTDYLKKLLLKVKAPETIKDQKGTTLIVAGKQLTEKVIEKLTPEILRPLLSKFKKLEVSLLRIESNYERRLARLQQKRLKNLERVKKGDELPPGVIKVVKVYLAKRRRLSVGDKMAGRHGNKGVIAKILPEEDMPYLEDGTTVEIVLNPLGVPSRMNVGQVLETHLGWAAYKLGCSVSTPVFDGASEAEIKELLSKAGLPEDGRVILYDGRTGEAFDQKITVGNIYIMKLAHLVDDKIHARSIGPYSLVTQQPLGGKAQFGGQRLGEMEVWALEAYGAAFALREFLTVKSDDVNGRTSMYEAIVKGENKLMAGIPESFNVLEKELRGLCLNLAREKVSVEEVVDKEDEGVLAEVVSSEGESAND